MPKIKNTHTHYSQHIVEKAEAEKIVIYFFLHEEEKQWEILLLGQLIYSTKHTV